MLATEVTKADSRIATRYFDTHFTLRLKPFKLDLNQIMNSQTYFEYEFIE